MPPALDPSGEKSRGSWWRGDHGHRVQDGFRGRVMGGEVGSARRRYMVELSRALLRGVRVADLFKESQRGVDHAWARAIEAVRALFDRLDKLIAMVRALCEERQDEKLKVGRTKTACARKVSPSRATEKSTVAMAEAMAPAAPTDRVKERAKVVCEREAIRKHVSYDTSYDGSGQEPRQSCNPL